MKERLFLSTKFINPTTAKDVIWVACFLEKMKQSDNYPVILVRAGAGYGKSTMVSKYFGLSKKDYFWLTITEEDSELPVFLNNLLLSVRTRRPDLAGEALRMLEESEDLNSSWKYVLNSLINDLHRMTPKDRHSYLVIDDYHLIQKQPDNNRALEYLIRHLPPGTHIVVTSRYPYTLLPVSKWKLKGHALIIEEEDLAFSEREIIQFFRIRTGYRPVQSEAARIREVTEGWAIALEMVAESIAGAGGIDAVITNIRENSKDLFRFLASDILERLPSEIRQFILESSILRNLNNSICGHLFGPDSRDYLQEALNRGLLLHDYGHGNYGFHRLFRDFLLYAAEQEGLDLRGLRRKAADYYLRKGSNEEAIEYMIEGGAHREAARLILQVAPGMLKNARFKTVQGWLDSLPPPIYAREPRLYLLRGDVKRSTSSFYEALSVYEEAERICRLRADWDGVAEALERRALVFVDTAEPGKAEPLLQEALKTRESINRGEIGALLGLIAENNLNLGRVGRTAELIEGIRKKDIDPNPTLQARFLLRTGKLNDAVAFTETCLASTEYLRDKFPKSHRELRLVLSLLYSLLGIRNRESMELAREVLLASRQVGSRFTESVAAARIGHAHQVGGDLERAIYWYREAVRLSDEVGIPRGKGEPLWGLTLAYGFMEDLDNAQLCADSGYGICSEVNDWWLAFLPRLAQGVGYYVGHCYPEGLEVLRTARQGLEQTGDSFGRTVALLWEGMTCWRMGDTPGMLAAVNEIASLCGSGGPYAFLFQRKNLWSPRDMGELKSFLIECDRKGPTRLGSAPAPYHPGYTLAVKTLGQFAVSRGTDAVAPNEWTRYKAKRLLQMMIARRGQLLPREYLIDTLWPDKSREMGAKNLKVTLSTLNTILEPRRPEETSYFIVRSGDRYGVLDLDSVAVDADRFLTLANRGIGYFKQNMLNHAEETLEQAIELYGGDFLDDAECHEWAAPERDRLKRLFLEAADALAQVYLARGRYQECLAMCDTILSRDNCWENAYRLMIICHARAGDKARAVQAYDRCKETLHKCLGVRPSQETVSTLKENIRNL